MPEQERSPQELLESHRKHGGDSTNADEPSLPKDDVDPDPADLHSIYLGHENSYKRNLAKALINAHTAALDKLREIEDGNYDAIVGLGGLDGRKRFVKQFKDLANQVESRKWELTDPRYPYVLYYDSEREEYHLQHKDIDGRESLQRKLAAYEEMKKTIHNYGIGEESRTYNRPLSEA